MAVIGLVARFSCCCAVEALAREVVVWAQERGHTVLCESETATVLGGAEDAVPAGELVRAADPIVVLGGDGTLIGVGRHSGARGPLFVGVNFGRLGFLTEIAPAEVFQCISDALAGKAPYGERQMLLAEVYRAGRKIFSSQAVNDAVVHKGSRERILSLDLGVNGEHVMRLSGDGIIFATPAGSTAYSLSAGGAIAHPSLAVLLVTPICAHSLTSRPLVLPLESELTVAIPPYEGAIHITVDGQVSEALQSGDQVRIGRAEGTVRFVHSRSQTYFDILRTRLNWGIPNQAG